MSFEMEVLNFLETKLSNRGNVASFQIALPSFVVGNGE
jgi:hypothetical protein